MYSLESGLNAIPFADRKTHGNTRGKVNRCVCVESCGNGSEIRQLHLSHNGLHMFDIWWYNIDMGHL